MSFESSSSSDSASASASRSSSGSDVTSSDVLSSVRYSVNSDSDSSSSSSHPNAGKNMDAFNTACKVGDASRIRKLLKHGLPANSVDAKGRNGLHLVASNGDHVEVAEVLLAAGAKVNQLDERGYTPLDKAIQHGAGEVKALLVASGGEARRVKAKTLLDAADLGDVGAVKARLAAGDDVEMHNKVGRTALHVAAAEGNEGIVLLLLKAGADPLAKDIFGVTPLEEAERHKASKGASVVHDLLVAQVGGGHSSVAWYQNKLFVVMALLQVVFLVLFYLTTQYGEGPDKHFVLVDGELEADAMIADTYGLYQDVHVMIFIGFGFLMTFLRKYGFSSVGLNFFLATFVIEWHILFGGYVHNFAAGHLLSEKISIDMENLLLADFAAAAVLITFGAVLGKLSALQMVFVAFAEIIFFAINEQIAIELEVADVGGSMVVHVFGAYFGLAVSYMASTRASKASGTENGSDYRSDLFSMIGALFLWVFWPSFNSAPASGALRHRAIVNSVLALSGSAVMGFVVSHVTSGIKKFEMVHIANATLAGGVAVGAIANMPIQPGSALLIGSLGGTASTLAFVYVVPKLQVWFGIHDTCGVQALHGIPGILSGLASAIVAWASTCDTFGGPERLAAHYSRFSPETEDCSSTAQGSYQILYLIITLAHALIAGTVVGAIVRLKWFEPVREYYLDTEVFEVPMEESPFYFDKHGLQEAVAVIVGQLEAREGRDYSSVFSQEESVDQAPKSKSKSKAKAKSKAGKKKGSTKKGSTKKGSKGKGKARKSRK